MNGSSRAESISPRSESARYVFSSDDCARDILVVFRAEHCMDALLDDIPIGVQQVVEGTLGPVNMAEALKPRSQYILVDDDVARKHSLVRA
jgi:hypothetical protein